MKTRFTLAVGLWLVGCSGSSKGPVEVLRGEFRQPSLKVVDARGSDPDWVLAEEQGYVQAVDRFLQMDLMRRSGRGQVAELLGEGAFSQDRQILATGLPESVVRGEVRLRAEHPAAHAILEAFTRGVNRFISELPGRDPDLVRSYRALTHEPTYLPRNWEAADSVAVGSTIAFYLSSYLQEKIALGGIAALYLAKQNPLEWLKFTNLFDLRPLENTFILDADNRAKDFSTVRHSAEATPPAPKILPQTECLARPFPFPECARKSSFGSNNWVVGPNLTGGGSILANDPHLPLTFPISFYEIALDSKSAGGTLRARGLSLPGVPGVLIGHNDDIAWGFTNLGADVDDLYIELMNDEETTTDFKSAKVALDSKPTVVKIRTLSGAVREQTVTVRWVPHHGPLLTDHIPDLKEKLKSLEEYYKRKVGLSYRWVGHRGGVDMAAILGVNRATGFNEFRTALQGFEAGAQNVVFADRKGNIGYYGHGLFPVRKYVSKAMPPYIPVPGTGLYEWEPEFRKEIPELYNPAKGRIITANNDPFGHSALPDVSGYQDYFGWGFDPGSRAARITELLDGTFRTNGKVTVADVKRIQFDHKDRMAAQALDLLRARRSHLELTEKGKRLADRLLSWDAVADRASTEATLAYEWIDGLLPAYFQSVDETRGPVMGVLFARTALGLKTVYHKLKADRSDGPNKLFTDSLEAAAQRTEEKATWRTQWGQVHRLQFINRFPGLIPTFVFPLERDGSWTTVDVAGESYGPNFRMVLDIPKDGGPIQGWNVLAGGNYGAFETDGWHRELLMWRNGEHRALVPFAP